MPAPKIRGQYSELDQISQAFNQNSEQLNGAVRNIKSAKDTLANGDWVGQGATAFYAEMDSEVLPALQRLVQALQQAGQVTRQISGIIKQAEGEAARCFQLVGSGAGGSAGTTGGAGTQADTGTPTPTPTPTPPESLQDKWANLSVDERKQVLQNMANDIAKQYGMDPVDVVFEEITDPKGGDARAFFSSKDGKIHIDVTNLNDPNDALLMRTVAHEMRHAVQHEMADKLWPEPFESWLYNLGFRHDFPDGITEDMARSWKDNFADYKKPPQDMTTDEGKKQQETYRNQPVEADARDYGQKFFDNLTVDKLEDYLNPPQPTPTPIPVPVPTPPSPTPTFTPTPSPA